MSEGHTWHDLLLPALRGIGVDAQLEPAKGIIIVNNSPIGWINLHIDDWSSETGSQFYLEVHYWIPDVRMDRAKAVLARHDGRLSDVQEMTTPLDGDHELERL